MTPLDAFILPARARPELWRFVSSFFLICAILVIWAILVTIVPVIWDCIILACDGAVDTPSDPLNSAGNPEPTVVLLILLVGVWPAVWIAGRVLHKQSLRAFIAPRFVSAGKYILYGVGMGLVLNAILVAGGFLLNNDILPGLDFDRWIILVGPVVALTCFQAAGEELLFRGYFLQQLAIRSRHWLVWAALPSFLFGLLHYDPELPNGGGYYYVVDTFLFGLLCCALVWRSGSLWMAIGLHVVWNISSLTLLGLEDMSGTQLWLLRSTDLTPLFLSNIALVGLSLAFVLSPLGRIFEPERSQTSG